MSTSGCKRLLSWCSYTGAKAGAAEGCDAHSLAFILAAHKVCARLLRADAGVQLRFQVLRKGP